MMKRNIVFLSLMAATSLSFADGVLPPPYVPLTLDKVQFQISTKQWVATQTALLNVTINVTLNNADLVKARADIMAKLNKIAAGDWHLVQFDRSQDSSGLEKLYVQAQARVEQASLTDIYQNAKSNSAPGAQYSVSGVEFKPSLDEIQAVRATIREKLYQQVNDELNRLNKVYPGQHYSVSNLVFMEGDTPPMPTVGYANKSLNTMAMASPAPLSVSNEIIITAMVEAASNRKQGN